MILEMGLGKMREHIALLRYYTKHMRVLIVEDYEVLQKSLHKIFNSLFMEVDVAANGVEALELYKKRIAANERYDILFSDIAMPFMDGVTLTKEIRRLSKEQVIMIFSAHQDSRYLLELINLEVRRFILKPISLSQLLDEILFVCKDLYDAKNLSPIIVLRKNVLYNKETKEVTVDGALVKLTNQEQLILQLFCSKLHQSVSNEEIVEYLYIFGIDIEFANVRKAVYKLRKKLNNHLIHNVHAIGYKIQ